MTLRLGLHLLEEGSVATTGDLHDEDTWAWPCPYCRHSNALTASVCGACGAQLRDPEEDDLFTTVATEMAVVVDDGGAATPTAREMLWSTDASPPEEVAESVVDVPDPEPESRSQGAAQGPGHGSSAPGAFPGAAPDPSAPAGPFTSAQRQVGTPAAPPPGGTVFGAGAGRGEPTGEAPGVVTGRNPFAAGAPADPAPAPAWGTPAPAAPPSAVPAPQPAAAPAPSTPADPFAGVAGRPPRSTPDSHGLSVAVEGLDPVEREACAVPIAVCGALLGGQEVVLGALAGQLLGHPAVVVLTNDRVLIANARRWKPLVDEFVPGPEVQVHLRHDRDVASITFVAGDRLTGVDAITDVAGAISLAERIRASGT
jgi:hypothetical protein